MLEPDDIPILATNYAAHAHDALRQIRRTIPTSWIQSRADLDELQRLVWHSEKFLLPANGSLLGTEEYREHYFDLLRLPFPVTCLEIPITQSDNLEGSAVSKVLLIAWTRSALVAWPSVIDTDDAINFTIMTYWNRAWQIPPGFCGFSPSNIEFCGSKDVGYNAHHAFPEYFAQCARHEVARDLQGIFASGFNALLEFCLTINCENVTQELLGPSKVLNQTRASKGKTPFFSYRFLRVPTPHRDSPALGGTHGSPRLHLRRGHLRRISPGRVIWVRHALVGTHQLGVVDKTYVVVR